MQIGVGETLYLHLLLLVIPIHQDTQHLSLCSLNEPYQYRQLFVAIFSPGLYP